MEFIRQVGNQAEVNDGGKIRRLPFSGEGVAPQPGARVNPVRDACCCPGAVPLSPLAPTAKLTPTPRRSVKQNDGSTVPNKFVSLGPQSRTSAIKFGPGFFEKTKFKELIGQNYRFNLYSNLRLTPPVPNTFVTWNSKNNTYTLSKLPLSPKPLVFYFWAERTFIGGGGIGVNGNYYASSGGSSHEVANRELLKLLKTPERYTDKTLLTPYGNPSTLNVTYYIFDPYIVDPYWYNSSALDEVVEAYSKGKPQQYYAAEINEFKRIHPKGKLFYHREIFSSPEQFKEWYKDPKSYKYERLY